MRKRLTPCVLDASVMLKVFLPEEHSEEAEALILEAVDRDDKLLHVPDLLFIECANVLWQKVRRGHISADAALENLAHLRRMNLPSTPTSELMERALQIAYLHGITAYDACYAALAELLGMPLLTADTRLADVLSTAGLQVATLG